MTDSKSATSIALSVQEKPLSPAEEVARAVRMRIDTMGLDKLDLVVKELEVSQTLLGSTSWWSEARRLCDEVLAEARKEAMAVQVVSTKAPRTAESTGSSEVGHWYPKGTPVRPR